MQIEGQADAPDRGQRSKAGTWRKGVSGNPAGRPAAERPEAPAERLFVAPRRNLKGQWEKGWSGNLVGRPHLPRDQARTPVSLIAALSALVADAGLPARVRAVALAQLGWLLPRVHDSDVDAVCAGMGAAVPPDPVDHVA